MREVEIIEVGPRDGLQNQQWVSTKEKMKLIDFLLDADTRKMEVTSFVHPKKVPQMADAEDVLKNVKKRKSFHSIALVPNIKGYERAKHCQPSEVNWVSSATETFNVKNIGLSIDESLEQYKSVVQLATMDNIQTCFSLAVSFGCPFEKEVSEKQVLSLVEKVLGIGVDRISIADTIGIAVPGQVKSLMAQILELTGQKPVTLHLHDTRGLGLANAYAALETDVTSFETAVSGIGGCPFAPGAAGNLATEDLVYMLERMGVKTGLDFDKLLIASDYAAELASEKPLGRIRNVENKNRGERHER